MPNRWGGARPGRLIVGVHAQPEHPDDVLPLDATGGAVVDVHGQDTFGHSWLAANERDQRPDHLRALVLVDNDRLALSIALGRRAAVQTWCGHFIRLVRPG